LKQSYKRQSSRRNLSNPEQDSRFSPRPFAIQAKPSANPPTPQEQEDAEFAQNKMESMRLQISEKYGTLTPEGSAKLGMLQAKMQGVLQARLDQASRGGFDLSKISVYPPGIQEAEAIQGKQAGEQQRTLHQVALNHLITPIQAKLTIGQPNDRYEQEADRAASQLVEQINSPASAQATLGQVGQQQDGPRGKLQAKSRNSQTYPSVHLNSDPGQHKSIRANAQPNLLEASIRNTQSGQKTEPKATTQSSAVQAKGDKKSDHQESLHRQTHHPENLHLSSSRAENTNLSNVSGMQLKPNTASQSTVQQAQNSPDGWINISKLGKPAIQCFRIKNKSGELVETRSMSYESLLDLRDWLEEQGDARKDDFNEVRKVINARDEALSRKQRTIQCFRVKNESDEWVETGLMSYDSLLDLRDWLKKQGDARKDDSYEVQSVIDARDRALLILKQRTDDPKWTKPISFGGLTYEEVFIRVEHLLVNNPMDIDQGSVGFCGVVSLLTGLLARNPVKFVNYVMDMCDFGKAELTGGKKKNEIKVKPGKKFKTRDAKHEASKRRMVDKNETGKITDNSRASDWMILGSIRDSENTTPVNPNSGLGALTQYTTNTEIVKWFKAAGAERVVEEGSFLTGAGRKKIQRAENYYKQGFIVVLAVNARAVESYDEYGDISSGSPKNLFTGHFVLMNGEITDEGEYLTCPVVTWRTTDKLFVKKKHVNSYFRGFIAATLNVSGSHTEGETNSDGSSITSLETWNDVAYALWKKGDLIRVTKHSTDISDRIFEVQEDHDPNMYEYPDIPKMKWVNK